MMRIEEFKNFTELGVIKALKYHTIAGHTSLMRFHSVLQSARFSSVDEDNNEQVANPILKMSWAMLLGIGPALRVVDVNSLLFNNEKMKLICVFFNYTNLVGVGYVRARPEPNIPLRANLGVLQAAFALEVDAIGALDLVEVKAVGALDLVKVEAVRALNLVDVEAVGALDLVEVEAVGALNLVEVETVGAHDLVEVKAVGALYLVEVREVGSSASSSSLED
nr:hypothetical protein [Tanacetum cinerariifolium]